MSPNPATTAIATTAGGATAAPTPSSSSATAAMALMLSTTTKNLKKVVTVASTAARNALGGGGGGGGGGAASTTSGSNMGSGSSGGGGRGDAEDGGNPNYLDRPRLHRRSNSHSGAISVEKARVEAAPPLPTPPWSLPQSSSSSSTSSSTTSSAGVVAGGVTPSSTSSTTTTNTTTTATTILKTGYEKAHAGFASVAAAAVGGLHRSQSQGKLGQMYRRDRDRDHDERRRENVKEKEKDMDGLSVGVGLGSAVPVTAQSLPTRSKTVEIRKDNIPTLETGVPAFAFTVINWHGEYSCCEWGYESWVGYHIDGLIAGQHFGIWLKTHISFVVSFIANGGWGWTRTRKWIRIAFTHARNADADFRFVAVVNYTSAINE
ncbi:hypothetical protein HK102_010724 [Quaeritorhiza haematococci]|nr:hypothetical protein HK102_010724 [Quaeritorhiza haematococci]